MIKKVVITSVVFLGGCNIANYGRAIQDDSNSIFVRKKQFILGLSFDAVIDVKEECERCNLNTYVIKSKLITISKEPKLFEKEYSPYFKFLDKEIILSVSKQLYESVNKGDIMTKLENSPYIVVGGKRILYLSLDEMKWIP